MAFNIPADRNQEATVWCGGLQPEVTEEIIWELFLQAGPVGENKQIPSVLIVFFSIREHAKR